VTRLLKVVGTELNSPGFQGGNSGGCAIPAFSKGVPQVQAVVIDFVAVGARGPGYLVAWSSDRQKPDSSVLTYWKQASLAGFNVAHSVVVPVRQDAQGGDISVQAQVSRTGLVAEVVGYLSSAPKGATGPAGPRGTGGCDRAAGPGGPAGPTGPAGANGATGPADQPARTELRVRPVRPERPERPERRDRLAFRVRRGRMG